MLLKFVRSHGSIDSFESVEVPDFTVITGVNGSGKSHLLAALNLGHVVMGGLPNPRIVLFNYETFRLDNEPSLTGHQLAAEREAAWQYHQQHFKPSLRNWRTALGAEYEPLKREATEKKRGFWYFGGAKLRQYKQNFRNLLNAKQHKQNHNAHGILSLAKRTPFSLDEIDHDEFVRRYQPFVLKNDFLPVQLGKIFWDYYVKFRQNQLNRFENATNGQKYKTFTDHEFIAEHGEKPWELANRILTAFDSLTYRFGTPEGADLFGNYKLELQHTGKPNLRIEFGMLSSGERILMALVASIYKSSTDGVFPDILLLDEIDASLHPSMIKNMLDVIRDVFLPAGVKVILVTHSPTTIALTDEEAVFVMQPSGTKRLVKRTQKDALRILTQGYATLDEGLRFFDQISNSELTIITEGYNTKYISKALELNGVQGITVLDGIEGQSGKNQLKTLFEFFSRMPHQRKILFVFDCDVNYHLTDTENTYSLIFEKNENNTIANSGIENLFDLSLFQGFSLKITSPDGIEQEKFHPPSKNKFCEFILSRNNLGDFSNFEPLIRKARELIQK